MMTFGEFAARLEQAAVKIDAELEVPTEAVMLLVEAQAREVIGTYNYGWKELAESTQKDRVSKGYTPDEPLLRTGDLAASIKHKAERSGAFFGAQGVVYSDSKIALYQELGTKNIPPRSFLFGSLARAIPEMERIYGAFIVRALTQW